MAPKKAAALPAGVRKAGTQGKKKKADDPYEHLIEPQTKTFGPGGMPHPKHDMRRWVKWPRYVRIQRQRRALGMRLSVPPAINQFSRTFDRNQAVHLFKLLMKYRPEDRKTKQLRLQKEAESRASGMEIEKKKPLYVKYGLRNVTNLVEAKTAQLVVIAHNVEPIELVVWLPALCKKMDVPYCIVKDKARLGTVVHKKNAAVLCITEVKSDDQKEFAKVAQTARATFNDGTRIGWGGGILGPKSAYALKKRERALQKELAKRMKA